MKYYNSTTGKWYNEGDSMTLRIDEHTLFSGVPTAEKLVEWGYEPYTEPVHVPTLDEKKAEKISEIQSYDNSPDVNTFYVNGIEAWFDKETRSNFRGSLSDAELIGETEVSVPINGNVITLTVQNAKLFLAQIQMYADRCAIVTATHISNVNNLETIGQVDAYSFMDNYPEKLSFNV